MRKRDAATQTEAWPDAATQSSGSDLAKRIFEPVMESVREAKKRKLDRDVRKGKEKEGRKQEKAFKKPLGFRKRLWHEPPELDYSYYEVYDALQKKFKELGGKDVEWRTKWLDLWTEQRLLDSYRRWTHDQQENKDTNDEEKEFYNGLGMNLKNDINEVGEENWDNHQRHGKTADDFDELLRLMESVRDREHKEVNR